MTKLAKHHEYTVKPLHKDPGYKDNLTSKDVTISPCKNLQGDKDNLHMRIILKNLGPYYQIILIAFEGWRPVPLNRQFLADVAQSLT